MRGLKDLIAAVVMVGLTVTSVVASEVKDPVESCTVAFQRMPTRSGASHSLSISLHTFAGSRWLQEEIRAAVVGVTGLLAQCGVSLSRVELCVVDAPRPFHFYSTPVSRELLRRILVSKPAVFFVDDTRNRPAYDAEAVGRGNATDRPELSDTVWVAHGALDLPLVLAHELVHVLSDSGAHSEEPDNLMRAETSALATRLSNDQCEHLRARGTANGLLQPVDSERR